MDPNSEFRGIPWRWLIFDSSLCSCLSHSGSVPIKCTQHRRWEGQTQSELCKEEKWPRSQILIGLHAPLGLSSLESKIPSHLGNKQTNKKLPRPVQFLLQCPEALGLGLLYPWIQNHSLRDDCSRVRRAHLIQSSLCYGWSTGPERWCDCPPRG